MKWHKGKINGNKGKVRRVKLNVNQTKLKKTVFINRPIQLKVSFEITNKPPEPAEMIAPSRSRHDAVETADAIRMITS